jgi:glutathione S-transferase
MQRAGSPEEIAGAIMYIVSDSAADITALATLDFAKGALKIEIGQHQKALQGWRDKVAARPSMSA